MGGSDKGNDMSEMVPDILKYVKVLVLNGATAQKYMILLQIMRDITSPVLK